MESVSTIKRWIKWGLWLLLGLVVLLMVSNWLAHTYQYRDKDPNRGSMTMPQPDAMGDRFNKVVYLEQGWKPEQSLWFYNTSQGSDLIPYDFFLALEQEKSGKRFADHDNMNAYRYLPQKPTSSNPDGLPVGFVRDNYKGKNYVGLTCAACHTGQVNYQGTAIRVDGAPAAADMESFITDLGKALSATQQDKDKLQRFIQTVLAKGDYRSASEVKTDLDAFTLRLQSYAFFNQPTRTNNPNIQYHYGRLDAFGRIYNRVLEHVMTGDQLRDILITEFGQAEYDRLKVKIDGVFSSQSHDTLLARLSRELTPDQRAHLRNRIFNPPNAPVSYPFLWDIAQHDYVQWNGLASNAGLGPLGRNAGEVIGVFGTLDWRAEDRNSLLTTLTGQKDAPFKVNYESSVNVHNLVGMEQQLTSLQSPQWPEAILGKFDPASVQRGRKLYDSQCMSCHDTLDRSDPKRRVVAQMTGLDVVKTDRTMADNSVSYIGYSGILRNLYVSAGVGNILIQRQAPVASLLTKADMNVILTPDPDKSRIRATLERVYDYINGYRENEISASIKQGTYTPDTTTAPFNSLQAYKARPLNGIWATAPYLHNGSVPTLYALLQPACTADSAPSDCRPAQFKVGSREFDPRLVGFRTDVGQLFDTRTPGNGNGGHEYGAVATKLPNGKAIPALTHQERLDLVEYLKTL